MLEIPESMTISRQLTDQIAGKVIKYVEANKSPHKFAWYSGNPEDYDFLLSGKKIGSSFANGGMIEIEVQDYRIQVCDGASPRFYEDCLKAPKKHQLYIEFTDDSALAVSVQMYGGLYVFKKGQNNNPYYLGACEKPSPLCNEFTYSYFQSLNTDLVKRKSLKAFLATEQRIPGLGNGVLQDILYQAGLHPKRKMNSISEDNFKNLYHTVKKVLEEMTEQGGRDTEKDLYGNQGGYVTYLSKNTYGRHCLKCGYEIHRENYMGGTIYFCDHCQPE